MNIDRAFIEKQLAEVRAQGQQALHIFHQCAGAEKVFNAMLERLDDDSSKAEPGDTTSPSGNTDITERDFIEAIKPRGTSARKSTTNGATQ